MRISFSFLRKCLTKTYRAPDCEQIGDDEENVDRNWKDQQGLRLLAKNSAFNFQGEFCEKVFFLKPGLECCAGEGTEHLLFVQASVTGCQGAPVDGS